MPPERKIKLASATSAGVDTHVGVNPAPAATPAPTPEAVAPAAPVPEAAAPGEPPASGGSGLGLKLRQKAAHPPPPPPVMPGLPPPPPPVAAAGPGPDEEPVPGAILNLTSPPKPAAPEPLKMTAVPPAAPAAPGPAAHAAKPMTPVEVPAEASAVPAKSDAAQVRQQAQALTTKKVGGGLSLKKPEGLSSGPPSAEEEPSKQPKKKAKINMGMVAAGLCSAVLLLVGVGLVVLPPAQRLAAAEGGSFPTPYVVTAFVLAGIIAILVTIPVKVSRMIGAILLFLLVAVGAAMIVGQALTVTMQLEKYQPYLPLAGTAASACAVLLGSLSLAVDCHKNNYILAVIMCVVAGALTQAPVADFVPKDFGAPAGTAATGPEGGAAPTGTPATVAGTPLPGAPMPSGVSPGVPSTGPAVVTAATADFAVLLPESWQQVTINELAAFTLREGGLTITVTKEAADGSKLGDYANAKQAAFTSDLKNAMGLQKPVAGQADRKEVWVFSNEDGIRSVVVEKGASRFCLICRGKRDILSKHSGEIDKIFQSFQAK